MTCMAEALQVTKGKFDVVSMAGAVIELERTRKSTSCMLVTEFPEREP